MSGAGECYYCLFVTLSTFSVVLTLIFYYIVSLSCLQYNQGSNSLVKQFASNTLQELKLQGIKIHDGVVFSVYSWAQCFAIHVSVFGLLYLCLGSSDGWALDLYSVEPEYQSG